MIIEQRTYTLRPATVRSYLKIYEADGLAVQTRHFPEMLGYFSTEIGVLNQIIHMWRFQSYEHRLSCREALAADPAWETYAVQTRPMIVAQETKLLTPARFSPIR